MKDKIFIDLSRSLICNVLHVAVDFLNAESFTAMLDEIPSNANLLITLFSS